MTRLKRPRRADRPDKRPKAPKAPKEPTPAPVPVPANAADAFVRCARQQVGKPYVWAAAGPDSFDCSGLVSFCFERATGQPISRSSHEQYRLGQTVPEGDLQPADLIFYDTAGDGAGHVGIVVGPDRAVHALNPGQGVVETRIAGANLGGPFIGARRLFPAKVAEAVPVPVPVPAASGEVTPRSPFRELGNTDRASFRAALERSITREPSPMAPEADAIYDALASRGLTRLGAAMAWIERSNETDPDGLVYYPWSYHNAWAVKTGGGWARYPSYAAAAADWVARILGPVYADLDTLSEFIGRYAPASDGNDPADYGRKAAEQINRLPRVAGENPGDPPSVDRWRAYPYPKMVDLLVSKPGEGAGFDRVAPRLEKIRGFCTHITDGVGTIEGIRDLFSVGGERAWDALTDLTIGRDGRIGLLNDWRNPDRGGRRAGWANGGVDGLEGEGVAFYRAYPDINVRLVSCEHIARAGEAWTDAEIAASIEVRTAIAQELKCPWDAYPYHPAFGGVSIEQQHRNFATKSCPAQPYIGTYDAIVRREVKAKLKAWQGGVAGEPVPEPEPVWYTRFGFSLEEITAFFGTMTRFNEDGTTDELPFDPSGSVSLLWLERCDREGVFPEAERIWFADAQFVDGKEVWASFEGGWTSFLPLADSRASWRWLDQELT